MRKEEWKIFDNTDAEIIHKHTYCYISKCLLFLLNDKAEIRYESRQHLD